VNDAKRLSVDLAMGAIIDRRHLTDTAALISQMGRFKIAQPTHAANLAALSHLQGCWIDRVRAAKPP
jgi:hypothetical protein